MTYLISGTHAAGDSARLAAALNTVASYAGHAATQLERGLGAPPAPGLPRSDAALRQSNTQAGHAVRTLQSEVLPQADLLKGIDGDGYAHKIATDAEQHLEAGIRAIRDDYRMSDMIDGVAALPEGSSLVAIAMFKAARDEAATAADLITFHGAERHTILDQLPPDVGGALA